MANILYSFRRCPYAMRARMALIYSQYKFDIFEIDLKNKAEEFLKDSPKGTVPALKLASGEVIDESLDIMIHALRQQDEDNWLEQLNESLALIKINDLEFKLKLDKYKYHVRFPEFSKQYYQQQGEEFLANLEERLTQHKYLIDDNIRLADIAIMPFIRQWKFTDAKSFEINDFPVSLFLNSTST